MAIVGQKAGTNMADINMTPMIDVLLVLLVIFIIAQPLLQRSLDAQLPVEKESTAPPAPPIVLEILGDGSYLLNTEPVPTGGLDARLRQVYEARPDKILFVKASGNATYGAVVGAPQAHAARPGRVARGSRPCAPASTGCYERCARSSAPRTTNGIYGTWGSVMPSTDR